MTDGGRDQETPLPYQERCDCGRILNPDWEYCPNCGTEQSSDTATDGGVPAIFSESPHATVVAGPEPIAFERWERDRE